VLPKATKYTSDLSDRKWEQLQVLLRLTQKKRGRPITLNLREVVNAMLYVLKTGCQ